MGQANKKGNQSNNKDASQKLNQQQPARSPHTGSSRKSQNSSAETEKGMKSDLSPSKSKDLTSSSKNFASASKSDKRQGAQQWDDIKPRSEKKSDAKSYESNRFNRTDLDKDSDDMDYDVNIDTEKDEIDNDVESKNTGDGRFHQTSNRGS